MPKIAVLDSTMFYEDAGEGALLVFLHGNPTSSYLWRSVVARIGAPGRFLAPDLIGMGRSGKPEIAYGFADHARYLDAWFDVLKLDGVVLVGHDWGGALGFDWATRHPDRVRGVAFMETIVRPFTWADFPGPARSRIETLRAPGAGEQKVLHENFFIEVALKATTLTGLADDDLEAYRAPYATPESRRPLLAWPRQFPIEGEPAEVHERVRAYDRWLTRSDQIPKLLLTFGGPSQTLIMTSELEAWCQANIAALEVVACGPAAHLVQEDRPEEIGDAIAAWLDRHGLRTSPFLSRDRRRATPRALPQRFA